jgi:hypothetical protein
MLDTWATLEPSEYDEAWDRFYATFQFKPSVKPSDWPGIIEPTDSVTFNIGHVYDGDPVAYVRKTNDLGAKLISAFRRCVAAEERIYVLDWQHTGYTFEPHGRFDYRNEEDWPVPALPNGDYYIFLSRDMSLGVFGHPWERTMCVFGRSLVDAFASEPPELFTKKVRIGGRAV